MENGELNEVLFGVKDLKIKNIRFENKPEKILMTGRL